MNGVLVVALVVPLLGALGVVVAGARTTSVTTAAALLTGACWVIVAAAGTAPTLGRITVDPVLAAALAGVALLVAGRPPVSTLGSCAGLCAVTLFAATAGSGGDGLPDRPLAAGLVAVALLTVVRLRIEDRDRIVPVALVFIGASVAAVGAATDDPTQAVMAVLIGAGVVLAIALRQAATGVALIPVLLLAVARITDAVRTDDPSIATRVALAGVAVGFVVAVAGALVFRRRPPALVHLAGLVAAAALVLLSQELPGARPAGLLIAVGSVAVAVGATRLVLVALLPGALATAEAFGPAVEPEHAGAGAVLVVLVLVALVRRPGAGRATERHWISHWPTAAAIVFGLVPSWGWAGATLDDQTRAVVAAAAFGLPFAVGLVALAARRTADPERAAETEVVDAPTEEPAAEQPDGVEPEPEPEPELELEPDAEPDLTRGPARGGGRIRARRSRAASSDGSSHQDLSQHEAAGSDVIVEDHAPS